MRTTSFGIKSLVYLVLLSELEVLVWRREYNQSIPSSPFYDPVTVASSVIPFHVSPCVA